MRSSILRKTVMGITGLFLCLFLLVHLSGNFLLFRGPEAFNAYSQFMAHNTFIRVNEFVLLFGFLFHIMDALLLTRKNRSARPVGYAVGSGNANSAWVSRNMGMTGSIVLVFLVVHLRTFFVEHRILHVEKTMYDSVVE
ncbi:MAG: succinate dehydrogenase, partial [Deltaproteobacteria bacterium]